MPKTVKKTEKKVQKKVDKVLKADLKADVYNVSGEKVGKVTLPSEVFASDANVALISQAVRVYLENQRLGTRKAKTRGEVAGSTRKLFRQKGTGRARAGSIKSPVQVGGGVAHGPRVKEYHLKMSQKMRRRALFASLTQKFQSGSIRFLNNLDNFPPKTSKMMDFIKDMKIIENNKKMTDNMILLVTGKTLKDVALACRNIPFMNISQVSQINTYQVLQNRNLLFLKDSLEYFNTEKDLKVKEKPVKKAVAGKAKK